MIFSAILRYRASEHGPSRQLPRPRRRLHLACAFAGPTGISAPVAQAPARLPLYINPLALAVFCFLSTYLPQPGTGGTPAPVATSVSTSIDLCPVTSFHTLMCTGLVSCRQVLTPGCVPGWPIRSRHCVLGALSSKVFC
jgi:hypothetical protein